jgi:hypothetical protein
MSEVPIECACGCKRPRRELSKYYSDKCCQKAARLAKLARAAAGHVPQPRVVPHAHRNHIPAHRPAVEIIDPKVADPYWITKTEFEANRFCFMAGTKVKIDGKEFVL